LLGRPQPGRRRLKLVRLQPRRHHRRSGQSHHRSQSGNPVPALKEGKDPPRHKAPREPRAPLGTSSPRAAIGLDERPSPIPPNPGRAGARPSQGSPLPQKAKTPAKAGVHLSTTTSTLSGLDRVPPFLDLFQQLLD